MKKYLILLLVLASCSTSKYLTVDNESQNSKNLKLNYSVTNTLPPVNVGLSPNDHTGEPIRTAFQKYNVLNDTVNKVNTVIGHVVTPTEFGYLSGVTSAIQTQLNGKQATLVSGTNIKTINSTSVLGAGNIVIGSGGSMVYPGAGIALSNGTAWTTSITNNSANWNTAYGWGNHASAGYALNSALANYVPTSRTVNGHYLSGNVTLTTSDVAAVATVDSASMLTKYARKASPAFTGSPTAPTQIVGDNSTKIATTAFVIANSGTDAALAVRVDSIVAALKDTTSITLLPVGAIADTSLVYYNGRIYFVVNSGTPFPNYYVSNAGDDSNNGLTPATSWAHHPWMSTWTGSVTLAAGSVVHMKRGDTWSISSPGAAYMTVAQNGSSGNPIVTTAYGSGAKPIIKIATNSDYAVIKGLGKSFVTFDNLDIQHYQGTQADTYQDGILFGKDISLNVPHDWVVTNCDIHNCPHNGINGIDDSYNITIGNISASVQATTSAYSNQIYNCGYAGVGLYGRNPSTDRSDWNVYGNYIHDIDPTSIGTNSYGIYFSENDQGTGQEQSKGWPAYCTAKYNYVANIPKWEGVECHGGNYMYFLNNYVKNCRTGIAAMTATAGGYETGVLNHCWVDGNTVEEPGNSPIDYFTFILCAGDDASTRPTNVSITNNACFYTARPSLETNGLGIYVYNTDGITVSGNHLYDGPQGSSRGGIRISYPSKPVKNVLVYGNFIKDWGKGIYLGEDIDGAVSIYSNIVNTNEIGFYAGTETPGGNVTIYNNIFLSAAAAGSPYGMDLRELTVGSGKSLTVENNIIGISSTTSNGYYILGPGTVTGTFTCNYNMYWNSSKASAFHSAGGARTYAVWQGYGYDANSFNNTDPLFVNTGGSYSLASDFALGTGSPALNVGTNTGVTLDYYGNPRNGNYDLGAIEKQ